MLTETANAFANSILSCTFICKILKLLQIKNYSQLLAEHHNGKFR